MSNKLLLDLVVKSDRLCNLRLFLFIFSVSCVIALSSGLSETSIKLCVLVWLLSAMAVCVLDFVGSLGVIRDSSTILSTTFTCPESEQHKNLKFARNILIAMGLCFAIAAIIFLIMASKGVADMQESIKEIQVKLQNPVAGAQQDPQTIIVEILSKLGLLFATVFLSGLFRLVSRILFFIKLKKFKEQLNQTRYVA